MSAANSSEQRAAFFDIDGTLTDAHTWNGFLNYFQAHHLRRGTHYLFLATHYPLYLLHRLGLINLGAFRRIWAAHMAWYVRGYTPQRALAVWDWAVEQFLAYHWRADTRSLLDDHRRHDDLVILVSSAPLPMVERIASEVGATHSVGTRFEVRDGRYTGHSLGPVCSDENKAALAKEFLHSRGLQIDWQGSYAYADTVADVPMLEMVGHPVAVYPDEALRITANERGWRVFPDG